MSPEVDREFSPNRSVRRPFNSSNATSDTVPLVAWMLGPKRKLIFTGYFPGKRSFINKERSDTTLKTRIVSLPFFVFLLRWGIMLTCSGPTVFYSEISEIN